MKINNKIISILIAATMFIWPMSSFAAVADNGKDASLKIDAKGAILMDAASGKVLFEQNSNDKLPLASVTKVMTMLLILEAVERGQLSLNDQVTISERAAGMGGSQMYLEAGEVQPLEILLEGVAICSANEELA